MPEVTAWNLLLSSLYRWRDPEEITDARSSAMAGLRQQPALPVYSSNVIHNASIIPGRRLDLQYLAWMHSRALRAAVGNLHICDDHAVVGFAAARGPRRCWNNAARAPDIIDAHEGQRDRYSRQP